MSIICWIHCYFCTRVSIISISSCTKLNSRVTAAASIFVVRNGTNSCSVSGRAANSLRPGNQSAFSMRYDLMRWRGISHQRSLSDRELACTLLTVSLICWPIFIPRQALEKDVFQWPGSLVSCESTKIACPNSSRGLCVSKLKCQQLHITIIIIVKCFIQL